MFMNMNLFLKKLKITCYLNKNQQLQNYKKKFNHMCGQMGLEGLSAIHLYYRVNNAFMLPKRTVKMDW